ncbi:hypothetical protein GUJ93_ZPchr0008g13592 [Zizania palustris]|uniref:Uncharacterized protein n=1 Tax=Zizania palustris TaxID=103762 RepID=A0A8J5V1J4_ZIZPA|nr:hypothetical protein GUJ93_ZPchr0008g13592 [Zizania palustris]
MAYKMPTLLEGFEAEELSSPPPPPPDSKSTPGKRTHPSRPHSAFPSGSISPDANRPGASPSAAAAEAQRL